MDTNWWRERHIPLTILQETSHVTKVSSVGILELKHAMLQEHSGKHCENVKLYYNRGKLCCCPLCNICVYVCFPRIPPSGSGEADGKCLQEIYPVVWRLSQLLQNLPFPRNPHMEHPWAEFRSRGQRTPQKHEELLECAHFSLRRVQSPSRDNAELILQVVLLPHSWEGENGPLKATWGREK